MAKVKSTATNASATAVMLNEIRRNASPAYQASVPVITTPAQIPVVNDIILGSNSLVTEVQGQLCYNIIPRLARVDAFENPYSSLDKGFTDPSSTIEDIFIDLVQALPYDREKAAAREYKLYEPKVDKALYATNYRVLYPITIDEIALRGALKGDTLLSFVQAEVAALYRSAYFDHSLLVKYMLIKNISHGYVYAKSIGDETKANDSAIAFRGMSNQMTFLKNKFNRARVRNNTPRERQVIFMDSNFNAKYDVDVLAQAFNMDKATFMGKLMLVDDWTEFDNDRFEVIRQQSAQNGGYIEEVTSAELALMEDVRAVLVDEDWFQIYQTVFEVRDVPVAMGLNRNYVLHDWKIVTTSPFANAICFVTSDATITVPDSITATVVSKEQDQNGAYIIKLSTDTGVASLKPANVEFVQDGQVADGIVVEPYGVIVIPYAKAATNITLKAKIDGVGYTATAAITASVTWGATVTLNKDV